MKFSLCNEMYQGWAIDDVLASAKELGYDGVELAPFTLAPNAADVPASERRRIRAKADELGLDLVGLHWLLVSPEGLYINHPDDSIRLRTRDYMFELVRLCGDLSGKVMIFGSPSQRNVTDGETYETVFERTRAVFRECAEFANGFGVTICMESLPPDDTNFCRTASEALDLVKAVDHENFQMMLDVKSMCSEGRPLNDIIRECAPYVRHIHANDANRRGPGFGDTDFAPVFSALTESGYDGYVSVEVFDYKPDPVTIAGKSLEHMRSVLAAV